MDGYIEGIPDIQAKPDNILFADEISWGKRSFPQFDTEKPRASAISINSDAQAHSDIGEGT